MRTQLLLAALTLASCATPGARPQDMSATEHEAQAAQHEKLAAEHADQYPPWSTTAKTRCPVGHGRFDYAYDFCWSSVVMPNEQHRDEAEEHTRHAADHRAASAALREAEATSCADIAPGDRDQSPFTHREDIIEVSALPARPPYDRHRPQDIIGVAISFRAVPGMTVQGLQHVVDCHIARNSALGHPLEEMPTCPLVPKGVSARVHAAANAFVVEVVGDDPQATKEIQQRAERLRAAVQPVSARGDKP